MTFDEFYSLYKEKEGKYTKIIVESIYKLGPSTWCSDIKTKKLVRINWSCSPIKFSEISHKCEQEDTKSLDWYRNVRILKYNCMIKNNVKILKLKDLQNLGINVK